MFALLRPGSVGRAAAIRASIFGTALLVAGPASAAAPNPVNETGKSVRHAELVAPAGKSVRSKSVSQFGW